MARWSESAFLRSQNVACAKSLPFAEQKRIYFRQLLAPLTGWSQRNKQIKPPPPSPPPTNQPVLDFRARSTPADDSLEKLPLWNCVRRFRAGGAHAFFLVHDPHLGRRQPSTLKAHPASIRRSSTNFLILSTKRPLSNLSQKGWTFGHHSFAIESSRQIPLTCSRHTERTPTHARSRVPATKGPQTRPSSPSRPRFSGIASQFFIV